MFLINSKTILIDNIFFSHDYFLSYHSSYFHQATIRGCGGLRNIRNTMTRKILMSQKVDSWNQLSRISAVWKNVSD